MGKKKAPHTRRHAARRIVGPSSNGLLLPVSGESSLSSSASASPTHATSFRPRLGLSGLSLPISSSSEDAPKAPKSRRKRQNSGDDEARKEEESSESEEEKEEQVTVTVSELERWKQRVIYHVEDYFTNEQLKRIAEFGRVHASMLQDAKQHVAGMEEQMMRQLEQERVALRAQAEEFVEKTKQENETLRQRVKGLETQVGGLQKQVDTLKQQVGALEADRTHSAPLVDSVQQRNCEPGTQQQAPLRSNTDQEQPEQREGNVKNLPTNGRQGEIPLGESNCPLPAKELNGTVSAKTAEPAPTQQHSEVQIERHRQLQKILQELRPPAPQKPTNDNTVASSVSMDLSEDHPHAPPSSQGVPASQSSSRLEST